MWFRKNNVLKVVNEHNEPVSLPMELAHKMSELTKKFSIGRRTETEHFFATDGIRTFTVTRITQITTKDNR